MKIGLLGYGKMGKLVEQMAQQQGHQVVATVSRRVGDIALLKEADVLIDFSHADAVLDHIRYAIHLRKNLVIGTTGWEADLPQARTLIEQAGIGCLYAPNFSMGVHLFTQIVSYAAQLLNVFKDYDVSGIEHHHRHKKDSPSGTAKALTQAIVEQLPALKDFQFTSVRCGYIPGTHSLCLDSPADTITLTHQARNREGFAQGALSAAEWLVGKQGFFGLEDITG